MPPPIDAASGGALRDSPACGAQQLSSAEPADQGNPIVNNLSTTTDQYHDSTTLISTTLTDSQTVEPGGAFPPVPPAGAPADVSRSRSCDHSTVASGAGLDGRDSAQKPRVCAPTTELPMDLGGTFCLTGLHSCLLQSILPPEPPLLMPFRRRPYDASGALSCRLVLFIRGRLTPLSSGRWRAHTADSL